MTVPSIAMATWRSLHRAVQEESVAGNLKQDGLGQEGLGFLQGLDGLLCFFSFFLDCFSSFLYLAEFFWG
jgi:hypothetical protein